MRRKILVSAIGGLLVVGALSACQEDVAEVAVPSTTAEPTAAEVEAVTEPVITPEAETVTETATETVTAEPEVVTVAPEPAPEPVEDASDEEIAGLAMEILWDSLTDTEREDLCWGLDMDEDRMIDAFMEGAGDSFDRSQVQDFFRGVC